MQNKPVREKPTVVRPQQVLTPKLAPKVASQQSEQKPNVEVKPAFKPIMNKLNELAPGTGRKTRSFFCLSY